MAVKGFHISGILPAELESQGLEAAGGGAFSPGVTVPEGAEFGSGWDMNKI